MTGSLSKNSASKNSAQWSALLMAPEAMAAEMRLQPEKWWSLQADRLASDWNESGLPTPQLEDWKYTNLSSLYAVARTPIIGSASFRAPKGVLVLKLSQLASETSAASIDANDVRTLLELDQGIFFENLAKSLVPDPIVVLVPDGFKSEEPIEIIWQGLPENRWVFGAAAIIVGEGADVSLIERYGANADAQTQSTSVLVRQRARLSHLRLQTGDGKSDGGYVLSSSRAKVMSNATYETAQISFGSKLCREDLIVELLEPGAEAITDGVFIGRSSQHLDHHTNLVHRVGNTSSGQIYKGILSDESRGVFNGRIAIEKNASGSNSSQMNKNLLLSKRVELDTKPQLEIDNDDVKAAHGAAIGRLDAEHIFYLRSRGIEMPQAVQMLARGFAGEAVARLSSASLRKAGAHEIERGLSGLSWEAL